MCTLVHTRGGEGTYGVHSTSKSGSVDSGRVLRGT